MNYYHIARLRLPKIQHQKSFKLHRRSFSGWFRKGAGIIFDLKGFQYLVYEWLQPITTQVAQDAQPKNIDSPLMLIFRIGK